MIIEEIDTEPESEVELRLKKHQRRQRYNIVLGFFVSQINNHHEYPFFIHTSKKGKKLADGAWGSLSESFNFFLRYQFEIVASSNGFLLCCCNNPMMMDHYVICNPATGQFRYIPDPPRNFSIPVVPPPILVSDGTNVSSLDHVHHQVLMARVLNQVRFVIQTFCSSGNKWKQAALVVDSSFPWNLENIPPFAIDEVIFWTATFRGLSGVGSALLAYDYSAKPSPARVIPGPPGRNHRNSRFRCHTGFFGPAEGKVHYARQNCDDFEIWVLEDLKIKDCWIMKHRVSLVFTGFVRSWLGLDDWRNGRLGPEVISFHPQNSGLVFMRLGFRAFCYDIKSRQIRGNVHSFGPSVKKFFLYEWPLQLSHVLDDDDSS